MSASNSNANPNLESLLASAKPFLRHEFEALDPRIPPLLSFLRSSGAGECYHRLGTFLDHLRNVYRIIKLWNAPDSLALCALYHSVYSNSYSNIVLFDPTTSRNIITNLVGQVSEYLINLFCFVNRQALVHKGILAQFTDAELREHISASEASLINAKEKGVFNGEESWRKKIQALVPASGMIGKNYKTGEDMHVTRRVIAVFLLLTLADISEQYFDFQDILYENKDGRLVLDGSRFDTLFPGTGKPGLWMNAASRMGAVYSLIVREEEIFIEEKKRKGIEGVDKERDEHIELVIPPVFDNLTKIVDAGEQIVARDLYWEVVYDEGKDEEKKEKGEELLLKAIEKNPFVAEPHVLLSQFYLSRGRYEEGEREAEKGLKLMLQWGITWDKRASWEGWVAWTRVLLSKAKEKSWPRTAWGVINLGLVR